MSLEIKQMLLFLALIFTFSDMLQLIKPKLDISVKIIYFILLYHRNLIFVFVFSPMPETCHVYATLKKIWNNKKPATKVIF